MKASKKIDGVVEAVRYTPDGHIAMVRVYKRLGATFTDRILLSREELLVLLRAGKHYVAGQRIIYQGASFDTAGDLSLGKENSRDRIHISDASGSGDNLKGVPLF